MRCAEDSAPVFTEMISVRKTLRGQGDEARPKVTLIGVDGFYDTLGRV
jgi:hypothetical protein